MSKIEIEIPKGFKAEQKTTQRGITVTFIKLPVIDFDSIKTGSVVKLKYSGMHCNGIDAINLEEPATVVFWNTKHYINSDGVFKQGAGNGDTFCVFNQGGNFVMFSANRQDEYVTEVLSY